MREIENAGTGGERDVVGVLVDSVKEDRSHGVARGNRLNGPATVGGYRVVPPSTHSHAQAHQWPGWWHAWNRRVPNICGYGLTESETGSLSGY